MTSNTDLKLTDTTPHTPAPNAIVADLQVGDRFVHWRSVETYSFSHERVVERIIRREGVVLSLGEPDDLYYGITGADRSEHRVCVRFQHPTLMAKEQQTGKRQRQSELFYLADEAVTIYRSVEVA